MILDENMAFDDKHILTSNLFIFLIFTRYYGYIHSNKSHKSRAYAYEYVTPNFFIP